LAIKNRALLTMFFILRTGRKTMRKGRSIPSGVSRWSFSFGLKVPRGRTRYHPLKPDGIADRLEAAIMEVSRILMPEVSAG
jgi:hypothetical protein